ncbi:MAG TPA: sigma-70 family RNA polymerase sigma factor [Mycobacteriales bacterium]|jgi:RNA polymerase sigma-70 factor (ECF subfamily)|nr:sigma-70 family RNA polymerase sigma factor [Mycobacteriales bacterium]
MPDPVDVAVAVADAHRREWAFVLAATVRASRDIDLAEECVQDAYARALESWAIDGIPERPGAWLTTVARRRAMDLLRREARFRDRMPLLVSDEATPGPGDESDDSEWDEAEWDETRIPDDRLRLICTCCHPALAQESQVALTLRLVCGLTTAEVARAFLVSEPTMAARITRAKKKISAAKIPYRVPPPDELPQRLTAVLAVVHLLFTTGHTAPVGADLVRGDLVSRATDLGRMLRSLLPQDPGVAGLLALILLTDARRATRTDRTGRLLLLEEQDRSQWNAAAIREGLALVGQSINTGGPDRYALQAAIAAVHARAARWQDTDWEEVVRLYDVLCDVWPSPVVALNRAVAVSLASGPQAGLDAIAVIEDDPALRGYGYLPAAQADMLARLGRDTEAAAAYESAIALTDNEVEQEFLRHRLALLR